MKKSVTFIPVDLPEDDGEMILVQVSMHLRCVVCGGRAGVYGKASVSQMLAGEESEAMGHCASLAYTNARNAFEGADSKCWSCQNA